MKLPSNYQPGFRVPGKKPVGAVEVNKHRRFRFVHWGDRELLTGEAPTYASGAGYRADYLDLSSEPSYAVANVNATPDGYPCSVIIDITPLSSGSVNRFFASSAYTAGYGGLWCELGGDNAFDMLVGSGSQASDGRRSFITSGGYAIGERMFIAATLESNISGRCFINGEEKSFSYSGSGAGIVDFGGSAQLGRIGYGNIPWLTTGQSELRLMVVLEESLTDSELFSLSKNPYQILKPANPIHLPIQVSGGGGTTLNADSGTFAQTGTDASLKADRLLSAISGSYTATTDAVNLLADRIIAAATGGYTAGGQDASLLADRTVNAGASSYTLTGQDVALLKQASLVMAAGSGAFALNTQSAQLLFNRVMPAASGSITLTGQDVTLQYVAGSTLVAGSGDFLASGGDVALVVDRKMQAATGSLTAVYDDAGLVRGYVMDATGENLTLTGQDLNLLLDRALQAGTATFTETGSPVVLLYSGIGQFPDLEGEITLVSVTPKITLESKTPKITVH